MKKKFVDLEKLMLERDKLMLDGQKITAKLSKVNAKIKKILARPDFLFLVRASRTWYNVLDAKKNTESTPQNLSK